jgi:hypothetical protein
MSRDIVVLPDHVLVARAAQPQNCLVIRVGPREFGVDLRWKAILYDNVRIGVAANVGTRDLAENVIRWRRLRTLIHAAILQRSRSS